MSEAPFREFYEASPDAVVVIDQAGRILFANSRVEALLGYLPQELVGKPYSVLMPERYRDTHAGHFGRYMSNPTPRMMGAGLEFFASRKDGSEFKIEISLSPYHALDGLVVIAAIRERDSLHHGKSVLEAEIADLRDVLSQAQLDAARLLKLAGIETTEHEAAERLQRLLLEELHHRMKNMLATVIGITSQTLRAAETLEQARLDISNRLVAMGRAQDLLLLASETGAQLADVISAAIEPFDSHEVRRFVVQTALIEIDPGAILPLTMSLNELCTNAIKYGALSNQTGRVNITSSVDEKAQLFTLTWAESGGPIVQEPTRRSFGTRLIGALATELHGEAPCDTNQLVSCTNSTFLLPSYERFAPIETMAATVPRRMWRHSNLFWPSPFVTDAFNRGTDLGHRRLFACSPCTNGELIHQRQVLGFRPIRFPVRPRPEQTRNVGNAGPF